RGGDQEKGDWRASPWRPRSDRPAELQVNHLLSSTTSAVDDFIFLSLGPGPVPGRACPVLLMRTAPAREARGLHLQFQSDIIRATRTDMKYRDELAKERLRALTRRQFFGRCATGIGTIALASLLEEQLLAGGSAPAASNA